MSAITLHIEGMSCHHCLNAVSKALHGVPGVTVHSVQIGRATLDYDPGVATVESIAQAVAAQGYRATAAQETT